MDSALPLLELFELLRQEPNLSLGPDNYMLLLNALEGGFGLPDVEALRRLCRLLWVKTHDQQTLFIFNTYFDQSIQHELTRATEPLSISIEQGQQEDLKQTRNREQKHADSGLDYSEPIPIYDQTSASEVPKPNLDSLLEQPFSEGSSDSGKIEYILREHPDIFPITVRQMKQSWRFLRRMRRAGQPTELDVEATVEKISRHGVIEDVVLVPPRTNQAQLLLLIDHGGSMTPYHQLVDELAATAIGAGRLSRSASFFFHNLPISKEGPLTDRFYDDDYFVFRDPTCTQAISFNRLIRSFDIAQMALLIISDAGAARHRRNRERVVATRHFLGYAKALKIRNIIWINPLPIHYWMDTTAMEIATLDLVQMYPLSLIGLTQGIRALRGRVDVKPWNKTGK